MSRALRTRPVTCGVVCVEETVANVITPFYSNFYIFAPRESVSDCRDACDSFKVLSRTENSLSLYNSGLSAHSGHRTQRPGGSECDIEHVHISRFPVASYDFLQLKRHGSNACDRPRTSRLPSKRPALVPPPLTRAHGARSRRHAIAVRAQPSWIHSSKIDGLPTYRP